MSIYKSNSENIKRAGEIIASGGIVAFPTETVYGLGADALSGDAVAKIFAAKKRPFFDPLIVHVDSVEMAHSLYGEKSPVLNSLIEKFWPGALTIVFTKS